MTTENTDAATRILTKTIRKLAKQLAKADQAMGVQRTIYRELLEEQDEVRQTLGTPLEDVVTAARMRMAELAEERERRQYANECRTLTADRMVELEARIERALAGLESSESDLDRIAAVHTALRGEA